MFSFNTIKEMGNGREMDGKWGKVLYILIVSALWLIFFLFFKGQNIGEWGCVPIPAFLIYFHI